MSFSTISLSLSFLPALFPPPRDLSSHGKSLKECEQSMQTNKPDLSFDADMFHILRSISLSRCCPRFLAEI